jgi:hypothetical protein
LNKGLAYEKDDINRDSLPLSLQASVVLWNPLPGRWVNALGFPEKRERDPDFDDDADEDTIKKWPSVFCEMSVE